MFSRPIQFLSILGFRIKLDLSWLLIAALIVWSLSSSYFPAQYPGFERTTYLILSVVGMLGLFASLVVHELSHALVARRFGLGVSGITLFLLGGVAELESEPQSAASEFWIAVVGPLTSLALAAMLWFLFQLADVSQTAAPVSAVIGYLAAINLVLAIFNLLPAFPLDGGRILRAFLWYRSSDLLTATRRASAIGTILAYMLIAFGFLSLFSGSQIGGIWPILIGLFLVFTARSAYQEVLSNSALQGKKVSAIMSYNPHVAAPVETLSELVNQTMLRQSVSFVPVVEDETLLGYVDNHVLKNIDRENWGNTTVGDVFVALEASQTVPPDMPVEHLLNRVRATGRRKFMVVENDQLLGIVSLSDLTAFLSVFTEVGPAPNLSANTPPNQAAT